MCQRRRVRLGLLPPKLVLLGRHLPLHLVHLRRHVRRLLPLGVHLPLDGVGADGQRLELDCDFLKEVVDGVRVVS